jgi:hypothetical protein
VHPGGRVVEEIGGEIGFIGEVHVAHLLLGHPAVAHLVVGIASVESVH